MENEVEYGQLSTPPKNVIAPELDTKNRYRLGDFHISLDENGSLVVCLFGFGAGSMLIKPVLANSIIIMDSEKLKKPKI